MKKNIAFLTCSFLNVFLCVSVYAQPVHIYVAENTNNEILRANLDGTSLKTIVTSSLAQTPFGLALDLANNAIYWSEPANGVIFKTTAKGDQGSFVLNGVGLPQEIEVDPVGQKIYWVDVTIPSSIKRADLDGTNIENVFTSPSSAGPEGIALDLTNNKIFWSDLFDNKIKMADFDGKNVQVVIAGLMSSSIPDVALDLPRGEIYWSGKSINSIQSAKIDGTSANPATIITGVVPESLAIDSSGSAPVLYWSEASGDVFSFDTGSGTQSPTQVLSQTDGLSRPLGIALSKAPPLTSDTTIDDAPGVSVDDTNDKVTLTFEDFDGAILSESANSSSTLPLVSKTPSVRYEATITNKTTSAIKKVVTKNTSATTKLKAGTYSAKYVAHIVTAKGVAKKQKKKAKIKAQIAVLKLNPSSVDNDNAIQEKKAQLKLAGFKIKSSTDDSPTTEEFTIN